MLEIDEMDIKMNSKRIKIEVELSLKTDLFLRDIVNFWGTN